ncbi:unnamed protein product [Symbiodinium sp. CCMP2592]|nr:unnamed protein product [Symbiodinium sp. CCMP2592]
MHPFLSDVCAILPSALSDFPSHGLSRRLSQKGAAARLQSVASGCRLGRPEGQEEAKLTESVGKAAGFDRDFDKDNTGETETVAEASWKAWGRDALASYGPCWDASAKVPFVGCPPRMLEAF